MKKFLLASTVLTILGIWLMSMAASPSPELVKVRYGANSVDFTGDGQPDLVVMGHRENFNAHSFDVVSFYIFFGSNEDTVPQWDIVPLIKKKKEQSEVTVSGGADCVLHDFRLLAGDDKNPVSLILADRELRDGYSEPETVTFTYFSLETNSDGVPGSPRYSFKPSRIVKSKMKYCDVGEAFQKELGIGSYAS